MKNFKGLFNFYKEIYDQEGIYAFLTTLFFGGFVVGVAKALNAHFSSDCLNPIEELIGGLGSVGLIGLVTYFIVAPIVSFVLGTFVILFTRLFHLFPRISLLEWKKYNFGSYISKVLSSKYFNQFLIIFIILCLCILIGYLGISIVDYIFYTNKC